MLHLNSIPSSSYPSFPFPHSHPSNIIWFIFRNCLANLFILFVFAPPCSIIFCVFFPIILASSYDEGGEVATDLEHTTNVYIELYGINK